MLPTYIIWGILISASILGMFGLIYEHVNNLKRELFSSNRELKRLKEKLKWNKKT